MKNFEYKMPYQMAKMILKKKKNFKGSNQDFLVRYVNDELGIMGTCVRVIEY